MSCGDEAGGICDDFTGWRGIHIFTPDKEQLRENVARSGHRPLAFEFAKDFYQQPGLTLWDKLRPYLLRFGKQTADTICRLKKQQQRQRLLQTKKQGHSRSMGV